jgi:hypothetical protein
MLSDNSIYRFFANLPVQIKTPLAEFNFSLDGEDEKHVFSEAMKDVKKLNYRINKVDRGSHVQHLVFLDGEEAKNRLRKTLLWTIICSQFQTFRSIWKVISKA